MKRAIGLAVLLLSGCLFSPSVPEGARLACDDDDDCPSEFTCAVSGRCASAAELASEPIDVVEPLAATPETISGAVDELSLRVVFDRRPDTFAVQVAGQTLDGCTLDDATLSCEVDADRFLEGNNLVLARASDAFGREVESEVRVLADRSAPEVAGGVGFVTIQGPPGSLEPTPRTATAGSTIAFSFVVDEALSVLPVVEVDGASVTFAPGEGATVDALSFAYSAVLEEEVPTGTYPFTVTLVDALGNTQTQALSTELTVDRDAPASADVDTLGALVLERRPWASFDVRVPTLRLVGASGAVEAGARVVVRTGQSAGSLTLGEALADNSGAFTSALIPFDLPRVFITVVDRAGNESEPAATRDSTWRASLGGKVAGSVLENPHTLTRVVAFDPARINDGVENIADVEVLSVSSAAAHLETPMHFARRPVSASVAPPVFEALFTYDPARGRVYRAPGVANFSTARPLMHLEQNSWVETPVDNTPPDTRLMVYDADRERLVAIEGDQLFILDDREWVFALQLDQARPSTGLGFDLPSGTILSIGDSGQLIGDTWQNLSRGPTQPSSVVNDPVTGELLVLDRPGRLWRFTGGDWQEGSLGITEPGTLLVDHARGRLLYLTGYTDDDSPVRLLEVQDDGSLDELLSLGQPCSLGGQTVNAAVIDPQTDRLLLTQGLENVVQLSECDVVVDLATLEVGSLSSVPGVAPEQTGARVVPYFTEGLVVVGGAISTARTGDSYLYSTRVSALVDDDDDLMNTGAVFLDESGVANVIGATRRARLVGTTWVSEDHGQFLSTAMHGAATNNGAIVLDPGSATYRVTDAGISTLNTSTRPDAQLGSMIFERHNDRVLHLERPVSAPSILWAFENDDWRQLATLDDVFGAAVLIYDEARSRALIFGPGQSGNGQLLEIDDDGLAHPRELSAPTAPRNVGFSPVLGLVNFSGDVLEVIDREGAVRPAYVLAVNVAASGLSPREVQGISIEARASTSGASAAGVLSNELDLAVFTHRWTRVQTASAAVASALSHTIDPALVPLAARATTRVAVIGSREGRSPVGQGARLSLEQLEVVFHLRE